jgi:hypothetical protein
MPVISCSESFSPSPARAGRIPARGRRRQRGQALTEVALSALLVLIPTFIFGWSLYSYGQARTTALNGARYAAWERTVWRDPGKAHLPSGTATRATNEIENLMVERFFARPGAAIQSTYAGDARATNAHLPSFYSLHNGDHSVDIERSAAGAGDGEAARPTLALNESSEKTSTVTALYSVLSALGGGGMPLEDKGLYVAEVKVKLNAVRNVKVFEDFNLTLAQRAAVVTDAWSAGGAAHEEAIVEPMVPAGALGDLTEVFSLLAEWTPFAEFKPGCVRGDIVPKEMLPPGTAQAGGVCR